MPHMLNRKAPPTFGWRLLTCISVVLVLGGCSGSSASSTESTEELSTTLAVPVSDNVPPVQQKYFELEDPINIEVCYDMAAPICSSAWYRDDQLAMGYHYPPAGGVPSSWNRDVNHWAALSERQRNDYLTTALWNFVARLGISGGVQKAPPEQISAEYEYALSNTNWLVDSLRAGENIVDLLESIRADERKLGSQEWLIDWRINAAIWVALPAIAPEFIPVVDSAVKYTN
jgi:hypothetical protein